MELWAGGGTQLPHVRHVLRRRVAPGMGARRVQTLRGVLGPPPTEATGCKVRILQRRWRLERRLQLRDVESTTGGVAPEPLWCFARRDLADTLLPAASSIAPADARVSQTQLQPVYRGGSLRRFARVTELEEVGPKVQPEALDTRSEWPEPHISRNHIIAYLTLRIGCTPFRRIDF